MGRPHAEPDPGSDPGSASLGTLWVGGYRSPEGLTPQRPQSRYMGVQNCTVKAER
jgi:hypothetical protein